MATSAGPAGLTAAGAEEREGAAAAGSDPAAPSAGPAAFLRLPAPFNEEGNRARGGRCRRDRAPAGAEGKAGPGGAAAGPAEAPEGARPGGTGAWGEGCVCGGVLALPVPPAGVGEAAGWLAAPLRPVPPPGCESGAPGTGRGWWGSPRSPPETG